jgi:hypothetical protein
VLQVGGPNDLRPQYISPGDLVDLRKEWTHGPFVILNGCETLQVQPATLNNLPGVIRNLGAAAIIGPEIEMFTTSASAIGESIVGGVLQHIPLDELMVRIRRHLLCEMNPMGLAYNVYAPSGLAWSRSVAQPALK